jgi:hypothetical protein
MPAFAKQDGSSASGLQLRVNNRGVALGAFRKVVLRTCNKKSKQQYRRRSSSSNVQVTAAASVVHPSTTNEYYYRYVPTSEARESYVRKHAGQAAST